MRLWNGRAEMGSGAGYELMTTYEYVITSGTKKDAVTFFSKMCLKKTF
jgi:hypothetical protein